MPDLRKDPLTGRWVIIAPDRAKRPMEPLAAEPTFDPFAEGHESATPPEVLAYRTPGTAANGPGWRVRVVPNKFPALQVEGQLDPRGEGLYDAMNGIGAHEVVIESPHYETNLARLPVGQVREVLTAYRDRLSDLKHDRRLVHATVFKNKGAAAGASLSHGHSQIIATSVLPGVVREKLAAAQAYHDLHGRCLFGDMVRQETADGRRVVLETPCFLAACPFASRFPFEVRVIPKTPGSHYEQAPRHLLDDLAGLLKTVLAKIDLALGDPAYNVIMHTAPFDPPDLPPYRWHLDLFPRLTGVAGFEWGSGMFINTVAPEQAAAFLRETDVPADYDRSPPEPA